MDLAKLQANQGTNMHAACMAYYSSYAIYSMSSHAYAARQADDIDSHFVGCPKGRRFH
jgi:hypothetical protein